MPPRLNLLPTRQSLSSLSLLRQPPQCAAAALPQQQPRSAQTNNGGVRAVSTTSASTVRNGGATALLRPGSAVGGLAYRPRSGGRRMMSSGKGGKGEGEGEDKGGVKEEEGVGLEGEGAGLGPVSEEAAELAKIMAKRSECGEVGAPELTHGSMVGDILKRDKDALKNAPKVLRDQMAAAAAASSKPSGSRSFSTSARLRESIFKHASNDAAAGEDPSVAAVRDMIAEATGGKIQEAESKGYKFDIPDKLPRSEHLKHRYDPMLDQFTKMLMRDGKLSAAQQQMDRILHYLRSSPAPTTDVSRPLLPGPPTPQLPLNPLLYLTLVIDSVAPLLRIKQQPGAGGGGRALPIPVPLALRQRRRTAIKWIIDASEKRRDAALSTRVAQEIVAVAEGKSSIWAKREQVHKSGTGARANIKKLGQGKMKFNK
ncbi:hypothetical protein FQN53_006837 [Emmonsiellopsis sp. PD_33]|nr:hypothetical protein FQN53_006837 [Emmonsiellopsis sp. PD_33]